MNPLHTYFKHYFYKRYKWKAADFEKMQASEFGVIEGILASLSQGAILEGFETLGATGLSVTLGPGAGVTPQGLYLGASGNVDVELDGDAAGIKNLVVLRALIDDVDNITKPTDPEEIVPLRERFRADLVVLSGDPGGDWPTPASGDTVVVGIETDATDVTAYDFTKCDLFGKKGPLSLGGEFTKIVANERWATHRSLAEVVFEQFDRIRIAETQVLDASVEIDEPDISLIFDQGRKIEKGTAATGIVAAASGISIRGPTFKDFDGGSDYGLVIESSADVLTLQDAVFDNCQNTYADNSDGANVYGLVEI